MTHVIKLEQFEGPLDLLLQLTEAEELDISEVSLAQVTDQFVEIIESSELDPHDIADFLNVAARLLLIKSKLLLPFLEEETPEDESDLATQLKMYSKFVEVSKTLDQLWKTNPTMHARIKLQLPKSVVPDFVEPKNVNQNVLHESISTVIERIKPLVKLPEKTIRRVISLREKIEHLSDYLKNKRSFHFFDSMKQADTQETIVSFLALLELVKQRKATVAQDETFADIYIEQLS